MNPVDSIRPIRAVFAEVRQLAHVFQPAVVVVSAMVARLRTDDPTSGEPETVANQFFDSLHGALDRLDRRAASRALRRATRVLAQPKIRKWFRGKWESILDDEGKRMRRSDRIRRHVEYFEGVERDVPFLSILVPAVVEPFSRDGLAALLKMVDLHRRYQMATGERRAAALKALAIHLTEHMHKRYVQIVEIIERIRRGETLGKRPTYGIATRNLRTWRPLELAHFAREDVVHIRNACSHDGGWTNSSDFTKVTLRDVGAGEKVWSREVSLDDLYEDLDDVAEEVFAIIASSHHVIAQKTSSMVFDTGLLEALNEADPLAAMKRVGDENIRPLFIPLERAVEACTQTVDASTAPPKKLAG